MEITKEEFERYERVRQSGVTNMMNISIIHRLSGLHPDKIHYIMKKYSELKEANEK